MFTMFPIKLEPLDIDLVAQGALPNLNKQNDTSDQQQQQQEVRTSGLTLKQVVARRKSDLMHKSCVAH